MNPNDKTTQRRFPAVDRKDRAMLNRPMTPEKTFLAPNGITIQTSTFADEPSQLAALLDAAFPDTFAGRTFYKQQPHCRILAFDGDTLVGQVGLDFRAITVDRQLFDIVGIIDLCVLPEHRGKGIASALLSAVEATAVTRDFAILFADEPALYARNGYVKVEPAKTRWFAIEDLRSHSVVERDMSGILMAKPLGTRQWPSGDIDLLGYLF